MSMNADPSDASALRVWGNGKIPVVYRNVKEPVLVRMPYAMDNRSWLQGYGCRRIEWLPGLQCWELPASHFTPVVEKLLYRFGHTYIIQPVRAKEKCAPSCWTARLLECVCPCLGANHGAETPGGRWYVINETCAVKWEGAELRWSLLTLPEEGNRKPRMYG